MDVLNIGFFCQVGNMFRVKFMAKKIDERQQNYFFERKANMTLKQKGKVQSINLYLSELIFSSNDYISYKLYLDFSSNQMSNHERSVFLNGN